MKIQVISIVVLIISFINVYGQDTDSILIEKRLRSLEYGVNKVSRQVVDNDYSNNSILKKQDNLKKIIDTLNYELFVAHVKIDSIYAYSQKLNNDLIGQKLLLKKSDVRNYIVVGALSLVIILLLIYIITIQKNLSYQILDKISGIEGQNIEISEKTEQLKGIRKTIKSLLSKREDSKKKKRKK